MAGGGFLNQAGDSRESISGEDVRNDEDSAVRAKQLIDYKTILPCYLTSHTDTANGMEDQQESF